jgi:general secretion pathway protein A
VLAGQSVLATLLNRDDLRQVKQRIEIRLQVRPTGTRRGGILHATSLALRGGQVALLSSSEAIALIARASRGIPRLVNSICDNALLRAPAGGDSWITFDNMRQLLRQLELDAGAEEQPSGYSNNGASRLNVVASGVPSSDHVPDRERFPARASGAPFIMRLASKLNLGTVQVVKTEQRLDV